jgi:rhamnosyltransferase
MKVHILMSTYNGGRFVRDQIDSIQKQTFQDWHLLIRDDGSSDDTVAIIREMQANDARITLINQPGDTNLGVIQSFYTLLKHEAADYYFFSDQDDFWVPEKLQLQLDEAQKYDPRMPLMIYTDLKVVDQDLKVIHESMIKVQSDHANTELVQELTENTVTGGVSLINHALAELWEHNPETDILMHDWYLALLATATGKLIYLPTPTELYRQHDANVLGARTLSKRVKKWLQPHLLFKAYWNLIMRSQEQAKPLLKLDQVSNQDKDMIQAFVTIMDQPLAERRRILNHYGFRKNRTFHTFVFRTLITTKFAYPKGDK